ncbi:hypothetical protein [Bradyrhizobium japonicum]|uniref:hypothetical protein n=1 Tax=Bradyrhizobium japonicum TaxID=375 RepID=UPI001B89F5C2|nr:hypothetical protein [Bradyrhizobium japonicum]MBR0974094.1 hypothetical protein [Bradyrhizobium japonicum]
MAELATTNRPKPISLKVREAIASMVTGDTKNITAAAAKVGLSREHLSRELSKPHIAEYLNQKVRRHLAVATTRAGAVKAELLDSDNAMVQDRASTFILGLAGIQPASQPSVNLNIEVKAGYVIDLRDDNEIPAKVIDHV